MPSLRTLLVHPSPEVRITLRENLQDAGFLRVLGECTTAGEAMELLDLVHYGVFFIGMELADDITGFELAQMLASREDRPAMVFIAQDESQAFRAFELGATDYLLWPFTEKRLERTYERLRQFKAHFKLIPMPQTPDRERILDDDDDDAEETLKLPLPEEEQDRFLSALQQAWDFTRRTGAVELEKLAVTVDGKTMLIPYSSIIFIEAYEDYSYVHTANQKHLTSYRLKSLEERLRHHRFFRVHRKYLVNLDMVNEIASLPGSNFMLRTAGRTRIELPISRRRISELKQILGL